MARKEKDRRISPLRVILMILLRVILVVVLIAVLGIGYLSIKEYKPDDIETLVIKDNNSSIADNTAVKNEKISILTWNVGYGALGDNADFFMDGGTHVLTADKERVDYNLSGMEQQINQLNPDIVYLQEVDINSTRSRKVDEIDYFERSLGFKYSTFAYNYKAEYVPYPIPPLGHVEAGLLTLTDYKIVQSERVQLPCPFSWPLRVVNLKRCLMVDRVPVYDNAGNDTGKELVLVNLHLEAYDSGEGKIAQTNLLKEYIQAEYDKGNYVIVAGDFNQTFSNCDSSAYPDLSGEWVPGVIDANDFQAGWSLLMDPTYPTCRSLIKPYTGESPDKHQFYMIDGFIVSDNIKVSSVETIDAGFIYTDHNPVYMEFELN